MPLVIVRFEDIITKLDQFSQNFALFHELTLDNTDWNLHPDCESNLSTVRELLPEDLDVADCSESARYELNKLKDALYDSWAWSIDQSKSAAKVRKVLQGLLKLGPAGRAMSADHVVESTGIKPVAVSRSAREKTAKAAPKGKPGRKPNDSKIKYLEFANSLRNRKPQVLWPDCADAVNKKFKLAGKDAYTTLSIKNAYTYEYVTKPAKAKAKKKSAKKSIK